MKFSQITPADTLAQKRSVDMSPFWGEGCVIYARPVTPADHMKVAKYPDSKGWPQNATMSGVVRMVILIALSDDGEPFFDEPIKDFQKLMKMPMEVLDALSGLVGDPSDEPQMDDLVKN